MELLVNLLFGLLAFFGVRWIAGQVGVPDPIGTIIAVIVAIVVFLANFAVQVL
jgi:hypothetical protein